jgi:hypothetical protein
VIIGWYKQYALKVQKNPTLMGNLNAMEVVTWLVSDDTVMEVSWAPGVFLSFWTQKRGAGVLQEVSNCLSQDMVQEAQLQFYIQYLPSIAGRIQVLHKEEDQQ